MRIWYYSAVFTNCYCETSKIFIYHIKHSFSIWQFTSVFIPKKFTSKYIFFTIFFSCPL